MRDDLHEAEHDRFVGWYDGDRLFGLSRLQQRIDDAIRAVTPVRQAHSSGNPGTKP